jgi:hypothetical protein
MFLESSPSFSDSFKGEKGVDRPPLSFLATYDPVLPHQVQSISLTLSNTLQLSKHFHKPYGLFMLLGLLYPWTALSLNGERFAPEGSF